MAEPPRRELSHLRCGLGQRGCGLGAGEGEHGYLLSAEYRAPLFLMPTSPMGEMVGFGLHAFTDVGDNWFDGASSGQSLIGYGVGAHILLVSWQLRFEVARTRDGDTRFQFMDRFNF